MTGVHDPGGLGHPIDEMWCWVCVHGPGDEAIMGALIGGQWMALVAAEEDRARRMERFARTAGKQAGKPVKLVKFVRSP